MYFTNNSILKLIDVISNLQMNMVTKHFFVLFTDICN